MAIPDKVREEASRLLAEYCTTRIPERVRDQIRLSFRFEGHVAYLTESGPSLQGRGAWTDMDIARFRYYAGRREWVLYCVDRNDKWHRYDLPRGGSSFRRLLREVDDDPTGIFWG
jgi:hypothetical protein